MMTAKRQRRELLLDLSTQSMCAAAKTLPDNLKSLPENINDYEPVVLEFLKVLARSKTLPKPSQQASGFSLNEVAVMLALDWVEDSEHVWTMSSQSNAPSANSSLPTLCREMIQKIKTSPYFLTQRSESFIMTMIDILLCCRLEALGDASSNRCLSVYSGVTINTKTKDGGRVGSITGRADWILGWGQKGEIENISIIVEAKAEGLAKSALPQLIAYLSGVQDAKELAGKSNLYVFGVATDSEDFYFVMLRPDRRVLISRCLDWDLDQTAIVNFLDHILKSAMESSPSTTPVEEENRTTARENFPKCLGRVFVHGGEEGEQGTEGEDEGSEYSVIEVDGISVVQRC